MPTITFPNSKPYDPIDNRPYAAVALLHGARKSPTFPCLVDTGSDFIVLPTSAASLIGLPLSGTKKTYRGVTGSASFDFEIGLQVDVEGCVITTDVLFAPTATVGFVPILGRVAILAAFDLGFNVSDWLWT